MKSAALKKSSFTLPIPEIFLVQKLKEELHEKSNTAVIRRALWELQKKMDRDKLRQQLREASLLVRRTQLSDMKELDQLADEGLE